MLSSLYNSQVIKDSILGRPKFIKEQVVFLNDSSPFTFMKGDSEYGHAVIMIPKFLRERMSKTWFETNFCRYINNETHYDKNRKIIKETWYYKSGKIVDSYNYEYDLSGRLKKEISKNDYSEDTKFYFYEGKNKIPRFEKSTYKIKNDPIKFYLRDNKEFDNLSVSKFDSISKTDSIFSITNKYMKNIGERSYISATDTIYRPRLTKVKIYDDFFRVVKEKIFEPNDYTLNKVFFNNEISYEYDPSGRIIKIARLNDDHYHNFLLKSNGKYDEDIKPGRTASNSTTEYSFNSNGYLHSMTHFYQGKISNQICFEYENNHIKKLFYVDTWGKKDDILKPNIITFKYKFDRYDNWIECIKNVDGKDLYVWKRQIEYYK